jgi:hypothetical protein
MDIEMPDCVANGLLFCETCGLGVDVRGIRLYNARYSHAGHLGGILLAGFTLSRARGAAQDDK